MELHLYSQSAKLPSNGLACHGNLPVFGEHDQVRGKVILGRNCYHTGCLSISIEGAFLYASTGMDRDDAATKFSGNTDSEKGKHVFFSSSTVLRVSPDSGSGLLQYPFRHAFTRRRPSASSLNLNAIAAERSFSFSFELPHGCRPGEEMPPSFAGSLKSDLSSELFDVTYKVKIIWEAHNEFENPRTRILEAQILIQPDEDVQSAGVLNPQSWLEMPLTSDRPVPFQCAVSLPASLTFTRESGILYFAVFKTIPRSADLAKEIASDATISVSLLRQVTVTTAAPSVTLPPLYTSESLTSHLESNSPHLHKGFLRSGHSKIAKALKGLDNNLGLCEKTVLPSLPIRIIFSESRILQNKICIGFPKRPHCQIRSPGGHPSLNSQASLPDGIHKSVIKLHEGILPSISWEGVSVKYYLDVSVLVGQDNSNARIPIRII